MAQLALGAAGAVAGFAIGGPTGAKIGWMVGSAIGGSLTKSKLPTVYGPRLNDLTIQSSAYGNAIPIPFGRVRLAGNLIWSGGRVEHTRVSTQRQGGKGGGGTKQTTVEYYYTCSFAIALCEGAIVGVRRIWANGALIYNIDPEANGGTILGTGLPLTVYTGSETQDPDPVIESFLGVGNVPAYRGTAYAVFNDLLLEQRWGQSIPNFEFEVVCAGTLIGLRGAPIYTLPQSGYLEFL